MKMLFCFTLGVLFPCVFFAQETFHAKPLAEKTSLHQYAAYSNTGQEKLTVQQAANLPFEPYENANPNIGFTEDYYWVHFRVSNTTEKPFSYYLETGRPITDRVDFYTIGASGNIAHQQSGDKMPFQERTTKHRKAIFTLDIPPGETLDVLLHYESDGEVLNIPLTLHNEKTLLDITYLEQLVFGFFYGILAIAAIVYLFFFFALRDKSFLYYALYVLLVGMMQFSLDGYFHQYLAPQSGWINLHAVVLFAILSAALLGRYAEVYLSIGKSSRLLPFFFKTIYGALAVLLLAVLFIPQALPYAYPAVNLLGLGVLIAIVASLVVLWVRERKLDKFFATGIFFLVLGFVLFILNNLSVLPNTFLSQNSAKLGTGLEIIFLSLSMANRIKRLKSEHEKMQHLALVRAQEMNELKSYFLSNLSHELRTPLNAIMGLADAMSNESDDRKVKNNSHIIKASSVRLLNMINDILDFSKIEKGELQLEKEPFDPVKVLGHLETSYRQQAEEKELAFQFNTNTNISGMALGDATRFTQIANNLLDNAVKFTSEGTVAVSLETKLGKNNTLQLQLVVSDTGVGIPKEKIETIFESLTQENSNNKRKYGGLGLGLYIIKILVDMHGGSIQVDSTRQTGTTCTLQLAYPLVPKTEAPPKKFPTDTYDLLGSRILVVEDDPINQMVLKTILKKWNGTEAAFANNGAEGLEHLKTGTFDLILMDLQMPVMDGYEASIAIRRGDVGAAIKTIPIIAVTADVMESTKRRVNEIGMDDYLAKPINKDKLYQKICALLEER